MDARRFDALAKLLDQTPSRRSALRLLAGTALTVLAGNLGRREVGATHFGCRHVGERCRKGRQCCSGICQRAAEGEPRACQAQPHSASNCQAAQDACAQGASGNNLCGQTPGECFCWMTTGGASFCGGGVFCSEPCKRDKDCAKRFGLAGVACLDCPGTCGGAGGFCATPCPNPKVP